MESIQRLFAFTKRALKGTGLGTLAALCAVLSIASVANATAPKLCVPLAQGVPYFGGYPNWWTQSADPNVNRLAFSFNDQDSRRTDDPRWAGALDIGHSMGATDNAEVRALYTTIGGENYLLLSWSAKSIGQFNVGSTAVVVGFKTPSGDPVVIKTQINAATTNGNPLSASQGAMSFSFFRKQGAANWSNAPQLAWASDKTRAWILPATLNSGALFTVQMAVPLGASGLNLAGGNFKMWYSIQPSVPLEGDPGLQSFSWPRGNPVDFAFYDTLTGVPHIPDPAQWGDFATGLQSGCAGVTLSENDIGVRNIDYPNNRNQISINVPDTFYALPRNYSTQALDMSDIKADFYFANWGTQRGDLTDQSWRQLTPTLRNVPVVTNPANPVDPAVTANPVSVPSNGRVQVSRDWSLSLTEKCRFFVEGQPSQHLATGCPSAPAPDVNPHGCLLVKPSSSRLEFLNDSVVRNMDFVKHSKSVRDAEIRLPSNAKGTRNVYLSVERRNMSAANDTTTVRKAATLETVGRTAIKTEPLAARTLKSKSEQLDEIIPMLSRGKLPKLQYDELAAIMPTYVVHAFHDLGKTVYLNGKRHKLLEQQTSFGYFAWHEGDIQGWTDSFQGARAIRPDFYKVAVPVNRPVRVKITSEAIERPIIKKPPVLRTPELRNPGIINRDTVLPGKVPQIVR